MAKQRNREITNTRVIQMFLNCALCLKERPAGESMESWSRINVGFTALGVQVWCVRHDCNVVHIDFQGQQHPANTTRRAT